MLRILVTTVTLSAFCAAPASAFTAKQAERCAQDLLQGYVAKRDRSNLVNVPSVTATAVGPDWRGLKQSDRDLLLRTARSIIREAFVSEPYYVFSNLYINPNVTQYDSGNYRVDGTVDIDTPDDPKTNHDFFALTEGSGCSILQVRIEGISTLTGKLREKLRQHPDTKKLMRRFQ